MKYILIKYKDIRSHWILKLISIETFLDSTDQDLSYVRVKICVAKLSNIDSSTNVALKYLKEKHFKYV